MSKKHKHDQKSLALPPSETELIDTNAVSDLAARVAQLETDKARLEARLNKTEPKSKSRFTWRKVGVATLILVGTISLAAANLSAWADRTLVDNAVYVKTITPIASDPAIQAAVQAEAFRQLAANVNFEQIVTDVLPEKANILAVPLAGQLKNYSNTLIGEVVRSQQFVTIWVAVNRKVHAQLITTVRNYEGDGKVDVSQLYSFISKQLETTPLKILTNQNLPANIGQIQLLDLTQLKQAHDALNTLQATRIWSWILALASFTGAILLSRRRMHTLMWIGISTIIMTVVTVIVFRITRTFALDQIIDPVNRAAALSIWTILLRGLFEQTGGFMAAGFVIAIGSWLVAGQGSVAGFRANLNHQAANLSYGIWANPKRSGFVRWISRMKRALEWVIVVVGVGILMLFSPLSIALVGGTAFGVLAGILVVEFIASASVDTV